MGKCVSTAHRNHMSNNLEPDQSVASTTNSNHNDINHTNHSMYGGISIKDRKINPDDDINDIAKSITNHGSIKNTRMRDSLSTVSGFSCSTNTISNHSTKTNSRRQSSTYDSVSNNNNHSNNNNNNNSHTRTRTNSISLNAIQFAIDQLGKSIHHNKQNNENDTNGIDVTNSLRIYDYTSTMNEINNNNTIPKAKIICFKDAANAVKTNNNNNGNRSSSHVFIHDTKVNFDDNGGSGSSTSDSECDDEGEDVSTIHENDTQNINTMNKINNTIAGSIESIHNNENENDDNAKRECKVYISDPNVEILFLSCYDPITWILCNDDNNYIKNLKTIVICETKHSNLIRECWYSDGSLPRLKGIEKLNNKCQIGLEMGFQARYLSDFKASYYSQTQTKQKRLKLIDYLENQYKCKITQIMQSSKAPKEITL